MFGFFKKKIKPSKGKEENKLLEVILCYYENSFNISDIFQVLTMGLNFYPTFIRVEDEDILLTEDMKLHLLSRNEDECKSILDRGIRFLDEQKKLHIYFIQTGPKPKTQTVYWLIEEIEALNSSFFYSLIHRDNFVSGYCCNLEDMTLQSVKELTYWKQKNKIPIKIIKNEFGDSIVDITKNPGRRGKIPHTWIMSCWKMWFGSPFFKYVSSDQLLSFPKAFEKKVINNNIISIQLYENPNDFEAVTSREIQQSFREWIKMDELEKLR